MKLGKNEKILGFVFGAFVLLFLMEKAVLTPFLERLDILDTKIEAGEKMLGRLFYIDSQKENTLRNFEKMKPYIEIGKTDEEALSVIMKRIEEIAKGCAAPLLNMKPDMASEKSERGYSIKRVDISVGGSQMNIIRFLYALENSSYPLTINKLDFKIKDKKTNLMEADVDIRFIYFL